MEAILTEGRERGEKRWSQGDFSREVVSISSFEGWAGVGQVMSIGKGDTL